MLSVLCDPDTVDKMKAIIFTETSTIGLREFPVTKSMLRREIRVVRTRFGEVNVKCSYYGGKLVNEKPEFEQCRMLALENGVTIEAVEKEVIKNL